MKQSIRKSEKNVLKPKKSGPMTSAETLNYTLPQKFRTDNVKKETLKKSLERKLAHPQNVLSQTMVTSFWKKKKSKTMGGVHT